MKELQVKLEIALQKPLLRICLLNKYSTRTVHPLRDALNQKRKYSTKVLKIEL
jgi:hypothetical protein